jgi:ComF family protein
MHAGGMRWWLKLDRALWPVDCVFCGGRIKVGTAPVCSACSDDLPWIRYCCRRCGLPLMSEPPAGVACGTCQERPLPFRKIVAPLRYAFPVDAALKACKFHRALHYLPAFEELLSAAIERLPGDVDALLPVPLFWRRQAMRGFNQADELCKLVARRLRLPVTRHVVRTRATVYQSGLKAPERRRNLRGAFAARARMPAKHVVIIDDVVTTGETCVQVGNVLRRAGARDVSVLAVARATTPR